MFFPLSRDTLTHRVVRGAVHLCGDDPSNKVDGVMGNTVDLGRTSQRVRVLNSVAESMAFWEIVKKILKGLGFEACHKYVALAGV